MDQLSVLKQYFGHTEFREGQAEMIRMILSHRDVFGIMPTGAGKSICYQVPALMMDGISIVVSPLISLMKDQVNALVQAGVKAAYLNSSLSAGQYAEVIKRASNGVYKIIYVAPERLLAEDFLQLCENSKIAMVTVDEAHCVSQWGQDFRPSYLKIVTFINQLPYRPVISAFTATATAEVKDDIIKILRLQDPFALTTGFNRENLFFEVQRPKKKFPALVEILSRNKEKSGIVYCATRKTVEAVCDELNGMKFSATRYHAGLSDEERHNNQDDFIFDRKTVMVATNAFGMGIDKSNVSFVVHYNMPKNPESYYQEAGRAGRDGTPAECILLYSAGDVRTNRFLIEHGGEGKEELDPEVKQAVLEKELERLKAITFYSTTTECLREYLLRYFGEHTANYCGNCSNCNTNFEMVDVTIEAQKILSCVYRICNKNNGVGKVMVADVLHGSKNEKIMRFRLDSIPTYGIMSDMPIHKIRKIIDFLILNGYLQLSGGEYPVVRLSGTSAEVLKGRESVTMKLPKEAELIARKEKKVYDVADDLFLELRALRSKLAAEAKVPAYIIFSNATLMDMCKKQPQTMEEFLEVSGVGEMKSARYGKVFVDLIADCISRKSE